MSHPPKQPAFGQKLSSRQAMELSLREAEKGFGRVSPNPPAGCVILDQNKGFLASGFHAAYGAPHAEIDALRKIKDKKLLKGAHLYVTLEPCAHYGKTPPCADELAKRPLAQVFYGREDPNPKTKGRGLGKLREKGIHAKKYPSFFAPQIQSLYEAFAYNMREQKTFISLKAAASLDGMLGLSDGSSQWITSQESRDYAGWLRGRYDGVLTGAGSFLEDSPRLNSRHPQFSGHPNKAVILNPKGDLLDLIPQSRLAQVRPLKNILAVTRPLSKAGGALPFPRISCAWREESSQFDLSDLKSKLFQSHGLSSLLVEGGPLTLSSFLEQDQAQKLYQFVAPCVLGGLKGRSWAEGLLTSSLKERKNLRLEAPRPLGPDILLIGRLCAGRP